MSQLDFNGVTTPVDPNIQTWRELLQNLESTRLTPDQVIASVRFDGDQITLFRGDEVLNLPLQSIAEIQVEAIATKTMLREAAKDAAGHMYNLQASMIDVAETFRTGNADQANKKLQYVFDGVKMLIALLRGIELSISDIMGGQKTSVDGAIEQMSPALQDLITAQTQRDWTLVADILEYDLVAHLSAMENVLNGFEADLSNS